MQNGLAKFIVAYECLLCLLSTNLRKILLMICQDDVADVFRLDCAIATNRT